VQSAIVKSLGEEEMQNGAVGIQVDRPLKEGVRPFEPAGGFLRDPTLHQRFEILRIRSQALLEVVEPALASGQIDFYPGYAATDLEFINKAKGEANGDAQATTDKLNTYLSSIGAKALTPSPALDGNAFAVTKATAAKYSLTKLSDLTAVASQLTLGGPSECATRPFCQPGLEKTYGAKFKAFKALDADGHVVQDQSLH